MFIVQNSVKKLDRLNRFAEIFEESITLNSLQYKHENDHPVNVGWNIGGAQFANYMTQRPENNIAFTLETAYFGTSDNKINPEKLFELGHCFARALKKYVETE